MDLKLSEIRRLYLLVGEVLELGADPIVWRCHLLDEFRSLLGGMLAINIEVDFNNKSIRPESVRFLDRGWGTDADRMFYLQSMQQFQQEGNYIQNPYCVPLTSPRDIRCITGYELLNKTNYQRNPFVNELLHPVNCDDGLSVATSLTDCQCEFHLYRNIGDPPFGERERMLAYLLMQEIFPHMDTRLAGFTDPSAGSLSTRKRQVLGLLLNGDSEKLIASKLGISPNTVHEYVRDVYRHFKVQSHVQLMARFLQVQQYLKNGTISEEI